VGAYWFHNGVNWRALGIYILGIVAALVFSNSTIWASPLAVNYLGGADLSLFVGFLLTGTLYYLIEGRRIRGTSGADAVIAAGAT
jgi:NCS1 family nucleobase:cation symporter-1